MCTGVCAAIGQCVQVLTVVKHRLDNYLLTVTNYEALLVQACQYLAWRDEVTRPGVDGVNPRRDSILSLPAGWIQRPSVGPASGMVVIREISGNSNLSRNFRQVKNLNSAPNRRKYFKQWSLIDISSVLYVTKMIKDSDNFCFLMIL